MIEKDFMEMMQFKLGLQDEQSFNQVEKGGRDGQKQHCTNARSRESAGIGSKEALFCLEQRVASAAVGKLDDSSVGTGLLCQI